MDPWLQLETLASRENDLVGAARGEWLQLAHDLKPTLADLPRILDLADVLLPAVDPARASTSSTEESGAGSDACRAFPSLGIADTLLVNLAGAIEWRDVSALRAADARSIVRIGALYFRLGSASRGRYVLQQLLAADGRAAALEIFADLMARDPPADARQVGIAFLPLFQRKEYAAAALFPRLLDCLARPETATLSLDVANYTTREGLLAEHPARNRAAELAGLLGGVVQRLLLMEERPQDYGGSVEQVRQSVADWVALCVSLCDALGLIGDVSTVGKLEQALGVGHRRLRTEAAFALARLAQKRGLDVLVELAAAPATRIRAIAYLEELGEIERVAAEHRTPQARTAGELAEWLARPSQFGLPPANVELVDHTRQFWPGFDAPVDCYLLSFEYRFPQGEYSNVGIVGPLTRALTADLEELVPADVYAVFAGWQAEHPEISERSAAELRDDERRLAEERLQPLSDQAFSQVALVKIGAFFGEKLLVASAARQGATGTLTGTVIVDGEKVEWYPRTAGPRSIGPNEAYWMHKGRKLLAAFNPASPDG